MTNRFNLSAYRITWIEIRPTSGRKVTIADSKRMGRVSIERNGYAYAHFANRENAMAWVSAQKNKKFSKAYEARLFSDKQFGLRKESDGYRVPFTTKQLNEVYTF